MLHAQQAISAPTIQAGISNDGHPVTRWRVEAQRLRTKDKQIVSPSFEVSTGMLCKLILVATPMGDKKGQASFQKSHGQGSVLLKFVDGPAVAPTVRFRISVGSGEQGQMWSGPVKHDFRECVVAGLDVDWDFRSAVDTKSSCFVVSLEVLPTRNFKVLRKTQNDGVQEFKRLPDYDEALDDVIAEKFRSGCASYAFNFRTPGATKRHYVLDFGTMTWQRSNHSDNGKLELLVDELRLQRNIVLAYGERPDDTNVIVPGQPCSLGPSGALPVRSLDDMHPTSSLEPAKVQPSPSLAMHCNSSSHTQLAQAANSPPPGCWLSPPQKVLCIPSSGLEERCHVGLPPGLPEPSSAASHQAWLSSQSVVNGLESSTKSCESKPVRLGCLTRIWA